MTDPYAETKAESLERLRTLVTGSGGGPLFRLRRGPGGQRPESLASGEKIGRILQRLQEQGMKTRTGRTWTEATLRWEIQRMGSASEESSSSGHENPAEQ